MNVTIHIPDWATHIVSDHTDMERDPHPVDAAKVAKFSFELPDDAYFEYAFLDAEGKMRADLQNETKADNPWYPNASAVIGPDYRADPHAHIEESLATGEVQRHRLESAHLSQTRRLTLYTPKGFENEALPCVYVQDGTAYFRIAKLNEVLEALLKDDLIRPAHLVFVEPISRSKEYRFNPHYRAFMVDELVPFVEERLKTTSERAAMGASLGGLVSATLALHHPELFGTVVAQSGAFLGTPEDMDFYRSEQSWVASELEAREREPIRWYTEVGTLEWLTNINRRVHKVLEAKGYEHAYAERNAGHNWVNWCNGLSHALRFALAK